MITQIKTHLVVVDIILILHLIKYNKKDALYSNQEIRILFIINTQILLATLSKLHCHIF